MVSPLDSQSVGTGFNPSAALYIVEITCSGLNKLVILSVSANWYQFRLGLMIRAFESTFRVDYWRVINVALTFF